MAVQRGYFVVDDSKLYAALRKKGYPSYSELARRLGIHRNTIGRYLNGEPALPEALEQILVRLDLSPSDVLRRQCVRREVCGLEIATLVDELSRAADGACLALFGSRARGDAKRYSDYDLGIYRPEKLDFSQYSKLLDRVAEWNDRQVTTVQLVHLSEADRRFLESIAEEIFFVGGSMVAWVGLLKEAGVEIHEQ